MTTTNLEDSIPYKNIITSSLSQEDIIFTTVFGYQELSLSKLKEISDLIPYSSVNFSFAGFYPLNIISQAKNIREPLTDFYKKTDVLVGYLDDCPLVNSIFKDSYHFFGKRYIFGVTKFQPPYYSWDVLSIIIKRKTESDFVCQLEFDKIISDLRKEIKEIYFKKDP